jgi:SRSO17 transposase
VLPTGQACASTTQGQHQPGAEVEVVGEHRSTGERNYFFNTPADMSIKQLAEAIKTRWVSEQIHMQLKEKSSLNHFERRSWQELHRHC